MIMTESHADTKTIKDLPPIPSRPITKPGASLRDKMMASNAYYEANKTAIIKEWEDTGRPVKLKRWGIFQSTLNGLLKRWGLRPKPEKKATQNPRLSTSDKAIKSESQTKSHHSYPATRKKPSDGKATKGGRLIHLGTYTVEEDQGLPNYPSWEDIKGEPEMVKLRWLDIYAEIVARFRDRMKGSV